MGVLPLDKSTNFIQAQQCMKGKSQKTENTKELLSYQKPISEITLDGLPRTRTKKSTISDTFIVFKVLANGTRQENETKVLRLEKGKTELKLFADHIIIYVVNSIQSNRQHG